MIEPNEKLATGTILLLTCGCYSDYSVTGIYRVLRDVTLSERASAWVPPRPLGLSSAPPQYYARYDADADFVATLVADGTLEKIEHVEIQTDDLEYAK